MKNSIFILLLSILFGTFSCSVQEKVVRNYKGQNESTLFSDMGKPTRVDNLKDGGKIDVYEKQTLLGRVPINTGGFRYDRFDSPKSTKTETYMFYVNPVGIIIDIKYDYRYER
jgi:hypothetical protein